MSSPSKTTTSSPSTPTLTPEQKQNLLQPFHMSLYLPLAAAFCRGDKDEAEDLAKQILQKQNVTPMIRAHCHLILGALGECGGHLEVAEGLFGEMERENEKVVEGLRKAMLGGEGAGEQKVEASEEAKEQVVEAD
ncbi:hypothetical protein Slin15195_G124880 [Septoria linicola]|uniref:Uncharacterized protein n=1 Tax=Septoria linicola TaxID=215465 RepID=A0A9Q9B1E3_9PEZI|nr:hypothetical protein Slin14017_G081070 [Septoria linicola]USW59169.1 hypothetical protein Slin15195_G124880 [Septoria linicola]